MRKCVLSVIRAGSLMARNTINLIQGLTGLHRFDRRPNLVIAVCRPLKVAKGLKKMELPFIFTLVLENIQ